MYDIPVYTAEKNLGLEETIKASAKIISNSLLVASEPFKIAIGTFKGKALAETDEQLLFYLKSVLVSTGWNKNSDVFDRVETWMARHSPEDKAVNYQHVNDDIIGHMTGCFVTDFDGNVIADNSTIDEIPLSFDIYDSCVLYRKWEKAELQERMDKLIEEIADHKWCVSMECFFKNFDYAMRRDDGSQKIVARNEKTAFLTKHLRAYGGNGVYEDWKVGRLLRGINFSGKGLVENPANPRSEIKQHSIARADLFAPQEIFYDLTTISEKAVYQSKNTMENKMTEVENAKLVETLKAEIEALKASLKENDIKDFKLKLEKAEAELKVATNELSRLTEEKSKTEASLVEARKALAELTTKSAELEVKANTAQAELDKIVAEKVALDEKNHRLKFAADKLNSGEASEKVEKLVAATEKLDRESFEAQVIAMSEWVSTNPQNGNTNFQHSTTVKTPPASTNMKKPSGETSKKGNAADVTALENVETNKDVALGGAADSGVDSVRRSISEAFGAKLGDK